MIAFLLWWTRWSCRWMLLPWVRLQFWRMWFKVSFFEQPARKKRSPGRPRRSLELVGRALMRNLIVLMKSRLDREPIALSTQPGCPETTFGLVKGAPSTVLAKASFQYLSGLDPTMRSTVRAIFRFRNSLASPMSTSSGAFDLLLSKRLVRISGSQRAYSETCLHRVICYGLCGIRNVTPPAKNNE